MVVSPRGSDGSAKKTTREIREWAIGKGLEVSLRGRISAEIEQAFHDAQPKKTQAKATPVRKTAATKNAATKTAVRKTVKKTVVKKPVTAKPSAEKQVAATASKVPAKTSSREIREWAIEEGLEVSLRGRISAEIEQAFHDAHAKEAQAKPAPVKKMAAEKTAAKNAAAAPVKRVATSNAPAEKKDTKKAAAQKTPVRKESATETAATKTPAEKTSVKSASASKASAKRTSREIREWAIGEGLEVSSRGRIPAEIERAFHDAHADMPVA